uniref:Doublecortin domain containing 2B n=1 Tax=Fundulus heteroclitus TaxID=8078 RepID=A0A3Q2QDF0_FUNHE
MLGGQGCMNVVVFRNGDPFYGGRRFVVNQRQVATMEAFLNEVTQSIGAPLAVRTLYTPRRGHRVTDLQDLKAGAQYVAAVMFYFVLRCMNTVARHCNAGALDRLDLLFGFPFSNPRASPLMSLFSVFRNGDLLCPPFRFIIPRSMQQDLDQVLSLITEKVSLRTGAVRRLCSLDGVSVSSAAELQTGRCYVAVGTERFKKLPYVELLVSKAAERYCVNKRCSVCVWKTFLVKFCCVFVTGKPSAFKGEEQTNREEVQGAEEVQEDENTATELPVDQVSFRHLTVIPLTSNKVQCENYTLK